MATRRTIVVAVDDSEASAYAFTWAFHNLFRKTDHVLVLSAAPVVSSNILASPSFDAAGSAYGAVHLAHPMAPEAAQRCITENFKSLVHKYMDQCARAGVKDALRLMIKDQQRISCEGEVVKGEPGSWIVDEADRVGADVVVVGSHGYGVIKRTFLGSISDYVLHHAHSTVIIVRLSEHLQEHDPLKSSGLPRTVVLAVDLSPEASYAVKWALENFCNKADKVIIYHVQPTTRFTPPMGTVPGPFGVQEIYLPPQDIIQDQVEALEESEKMVQEYMAYVLEEAQIACEGMVAEGPTEVKIFEGVKSLKADAIVVGYHEHGLLARTFLGSVSDYLSHSSPCPLIAVKMPKPGKREEEEKVTSNEHDHST